MYSDGKVLHRQESTSGEYLDRTQFYGKCEPKVFDKLVKLLIDSNFYNWKTDGWPQTDGPVWPDPRYVGLVKNNKRREVTIIEGSDKRGKVADQIHKIFLGLKLTQYKKKTEKSKD